MNDNKDFDRSFEIIQELTVGDKKRRLNYLSNLINSMDHNDPLLLITMKEINQLTKEILQFIELYTGNLKEHE